MPFRLSWPCDTSIPVTQYFMANPQIYERFGLPGHDGIDFGTPNDTPLFAAADGIVLTVGFQANGYGNWVKLRHADDDGIYFTIVAHLNRVQVSEGQTVRVGDRIGLSGDTGFSTAPHLHFSLQWQGATQNGFTTYRGFGRQATFPRDFVDPAPYLAPALKSPAQPANPNHPALRLDQNVISITRSQHASATPTDSPDPTPDSVPVRVVNTARFGGLKVRAQPDTSQTTITRLADGTTLRVKPTVEERGPINWRQIVTPPSYRDMWVAQSFNTQQYLEMLPEIETVTSPVTPDETENPREAAQQQPKPATPPTTEIARPTPDAIGMKVVNVAGFGGLKVRTQPNTAGKAVARIPDGTTVWVQPVTRDGGAIQWRQLLTPTTYRDMWVAQNFHTTHYLQQIADDAVVNELEPTPTPTSQPQADPEPQPQSEPTSPQPEPATATADGEPMVVANTGALHLNVRDSMTLTGQIVAKLKDGTLVTVKRESTTVGAITWRQLVTPPEYAGTWAAERFFKTHYLIPAPDDSDLTAPAVKVVEPTAATPTSNAAVLNSVEPAPLTGRFQLVDKGLYTALAIDGDTTPRMGVNVRELAYFGSSEWPWTNEGQRDAFCEEAAKLGMTWVRFYAPHKNYTHDQIVKRTRATLDAIHNAGLLGIVVLGDSLAETGLYPAGDEPFHTESMGHIHKRYWHDKSYEVNYIPLLQRLVSEFKDHPGLGMWQLMNEPAIYPQPASTADADAFAAFVDRASSLIYDEDVVHPISIGIINVAHAAPSAANQTAYPKKYLAARKYIHVVTCHCYQHTNVGDANALWDQEDRANVDSKAAAETERAYFLTEFGPSHAGNRAASGEAFLRRQMTGNRATAALQWGFMPTGSDVGVGDKLFGLSRANINREYDQLVGLYSQVHRRFHLV